MSIIYDALQKTQRNREYLKGQANVISQKSQHYHLKWMMLGTLVLLMSAGSGALVSIYMRPAGVSMPLKLVSSNVKPTPVPVPAPVSAANTPPPVPLISEWTLNGVLITDTEKVALINDQPYHLGDVVAGMKIVEIELNSVKLQNGQDLRELNV